MRVGPLLALALLGAGAAGCETPVGRYFANRARDFGECWRVEVHWVGLGVGVDALGVVHLGLDAHAQFATLGWDYGTVVAESSSDEYVGRLRGHLPFIPFHGDSGPHHSAHVGRPGHQCTILLPAIFSKCGPAWGKGWASADLWGPSPGDWQVWARVHAFDIEATVALGGGITVGFSPGEFLDFLVGWFGLDIAGDDRPA